MAKKDLANVTTNLAELANSLPSQNIAKGPATKKDRATRSKPKIKVVEEPIIQFSLSLRKSLRKELMVLASEEDMTMRAFVLDALKAKGLKVSDDDMVDRRRRF